MPTQREALVSALETEFAEQVSFSAAPPSTFTAPSVVVTPSDPFIEPRAAGPTAAESQVIESWDVLVVVSVKDPAAGIDQMRKISLRVMKAVSSVGAVWHSALAPRSVGEDNKSLVAVTNKVHFKYSPQGELA